MPFKIPTKREILAAAYSDLESLELTDSKGQPVRLAPRRPRSVAGVWAKMVAGAIHSLYRFLWWGILQFFIESAEDYWLRRHAATYGIYPKEASKAKGTAVFACSPGSVIPDGTIVMLGQDARYRVDGEVLATGETITVALVAETAGADGNASAGMPVSLVSPIEGVALEGSAPDGFSGGADAESTESLRRRALRRRREPPHGGAAHDYRDWAEEVSFVEDAFVFESHTGPGTVAVGFTVNNRTGDAAPVSTEAENEEVAAWIEAHEDPVTGLTVGRPVTAEVSVFTLPVQTVDFHIRITPLTDDIKARSEKVIRDLIARNGKPGVVIPATHIGEVLSSVVGEHDHEVLAPVGGILTASTEIPHPGQFQWELKP